MARRQRAGGATRWILKVIKRSPGQTGGVRRAAIGGH